MSDPLNPPDVLAQPQVPPIAPAGRVLTGAPGEPAQSHDGPTAVPSTADQLDALDGRLRDVESP